MQLKSFKIFILFFLVPLILWGSSRILVRGGDVEENPSLPVFATVRELMVSIIDPSADVFWNSVGTIIDKEGIHEFAPKTLQEWKDVRLGVLRLMEGANLLKVHGRRVALPNEGSRAPGVELDPVQIDALIKKNRMTFDGFATALQVVGKEALQAIEARDTVSMMKIGGRLDAVCESCHRTFWYPNERSPIKESFQSSPSGREHGVAWITKSVALDDYEKSRIFSTIVGH